MTLIDKLEEMSWPITGAIQCHAHLRLPDKGCAIEDLVVCWVLVNLIPRVFGRKRRDLASLSYPWLLDLRFREIWILVAIIRGK